MTETPNERAPEDRLLVLAGPTASGKTRVALALAERFPIEVISADSVQVYRGFDIGSAKPTASERAQLPHHLVDILAPEDGMDAGEFERRASAAITDVRALSAWRSRSARTSSTKPPLSMASRRCSMARVSWSPGGSSTTMRDA